MLGLQVVELVEGDTAVDYKYYLLDTTQCTAEGSELDLSEDPCPKLYLKAGRLTPLDVYSFLHGPYTNLYGTVPHYKLYSNVTHQTLQYCTTLLQICGTVYMLNS